MKHIISSENGSRWITLSNNQTFDINSVSDLNTIVDKYPSEDWKTILNDIHRTRATKMSLIAKVVSVLTFVVAVTVICSFIIPKNTSSFSSVDSKTTIQQLHPVVGSCSQAQQKPSGFDTTNIDKSLLSLDNMNARSQEVKNSLLSPDSEKIIESELNSEQYSFGYN